MGEQAAPAAEVALAPAGGIGAEIQASPEAIWAILTDAPYQAWDSGVERVDGRIAPGEKITVRSKADPGRAFPVEVTETAPGQRVTGAAACRSACSRACAPSSWPRDRRVDPVQHAREVQRSAAAPDLAVHARPGPSFRQFATGLKQRAER